VCVCVCLLTNVAASSGIGRVYGPLGAPLAMPVKCEVRDDTQSLPLHYISSLVSYSSNYKAA